VDPIDAIEGDLADATDEQVKAVADWLATLDVKPDFRDALVKIRERLHAAGHYGEQSIPQTWSSFDVRLMKQEGYRTACRKATDWAREKGIIQ
jgi:hypothetical protein